jgi:CMP-N,N'-diacetyllegionaminic acid synthase
MAERVAIVPARGGSKGVPGKNKRMVRGKPLIAYTLEAALKSTKLDRIVVTTDDDEVAAIAAAAGVEVVQRPPEIAADDSPVIDAVLHALDALAIEEPAALVLLQPTSPLREGADIDAALDLFERTRTPVCSVCAVGDAHPARMYRIEDGLMRSLMSELASIRRQDLPALYHRNGAIYIVGPEQLRARQIICEPMVPYEMDSDKSVNIDTELDLVMLEALLGAGQ